ncbi:MAG: hypothetical protein ACXQS8_09530 [Candidatus Helarchaeales archaeon]
MDEDRPISSVSFPIKGEAGKTGSWRTVRPVLDPEKCVMVKSGKFSCFR